MCCEQLLARASVGGVRVDDPSEHLDLPATPAAARQARSFIAAHLAGVDDDAADSAALLTSELVTNGVLHARTGIRLGVTLGTERLLVTVGDGSTTHPRQPPRDDDRPSGRGMLLVDSLASEWGIHDRDGGKTVWFTVPRSGR